MGKRRRGKSHSKRNSSVAGSKRDGAPLSPVALQDDADEAEKATAEEERDCVSPKMKRKKISKERNGHLMSAVPQVASPLDVNPIGNGSECGLGLPSTSCDSDSDSDSSDLPEVSISFGTPSLEGPLAYDSISEGAVYWCVFPRWPPWPAVVAGKSKPKKQTVQALFFNDLTMDPENYNGYQIKARKGIISQFSEVATERDKFMAEKVETHGRYQTLKKYIETAVEDAKLYIARKDELGTGVTVKDLYDSIARRKITEDMVRPEKSTPMFARSLVFPDEATNSDCAVESDKEEQDEGEGEGEEEEGSGAARMVDARQGATFDSRYDYKYCTKFFKRKTVKDALKGIMERRVPSKRHNTFFSGSNSERSASKFNNHLGPLVGLKRVHKEKIVNKLKGFVLQWKQECDVYCEVRYTFDVLLPESIVRMIADIDKVSLDAADHKYCNWHSLMAQSVTEPQDE